MSQLTISRLAREAGVSVETIRFYQRKGLVPEPDKPLGGIRHYSEQDVARVRFIKAAQRLGFTLDEVAQLLKLDDGAHCAEARAIAEHKLGDVRKKLDDLTRISAVLELVVARCGTSRGAVKCPLIASLQQT